MNHTEDRAELDRLENHCLNICTYIGPACSICDFEKQKAILAAKLKGEK